MGTEPLYYVTSHFDKIEGNGGYGIWNGQKGARKSDIHLSQFLSVLQCVAHTCVLHKIET